MPRPARHSAFTIVELLTVILIISVLIALLMPAMVRARQHARSLVCQSNLRQIFQASLNRSVEHRGYVQVVGNINGAVGGVGPDVLDDADEKRYAYFDDEGFRRPAPMQAALAPYLGVKNVRLDGAANLKADLAGGIVRQIFTCPAQAEPAEGLMIAGGGWGGIYVPTSYCFNEGVLGFELFSEHRLRANLTKARPAAEIVYATDGVPRTELGTGYVAWFPSAQGRCTLADCYTNANGTYQAGVASPFDPLRHPKFRMNAVFCDGHTESLIISERELARAVVLPE